MNAPFFLPPLSPYVCHSEGRSRCISCASASAAKSTDQSRTNSDLIIRLMGQGTGYHHLASPALT